MANEKLRYDVEINSRQGERALRDLGEAATDAGREIERGLDKSVDLDTGDAERSLRDLGEAATDAGQKLEGIEDAKIDVDTGDSERTIQDLISDVDKLTSEDATIVLALKGAQIQTDIDKIRLDLSDLRTTPTDVEIKIAQLGQLTGDLDTIKAKIVEIDNTKVDVDTSAVTAGAGQARQGIDEISDSARGANSALANMIGNTAQEVGALGNVAGPAGVAIGQMAEYASDAALAGEGLGSSLASMAKVAGPIAGIAATFVLVSNALGAARERAEAAEEHMQRLTDIMREGGDVGGAYARMLEETGLVVENLDESFIEFGKSLFGIGDDFDRLDELLAQSGITFREWGRAITGTVEDSQRMQDALDAAVESGAITEDQWDALTQALTGGREEWAKTGLTVEQTARLMRMSMEDANAALKALQDPLETLPDLWATLIRDAKDGSFEFENAADAINQLAVATGLTTDEVIRLVDTEAAKALDADRQAAEGLAGAMVEISESTAADAVEALSAVAAEAAANHEALAEAVRQAGAEMATAESRAAGIAAAFDRINVPSELTGAQEAIDFSDNMTALGEAVATAKGEIDDFATTDVVPDSWDEIRNMPAELGGVVDAVAQMRDSVQSEMAQAFERGGAAEVRTWAANARTAITEQLRAAGIESQAQIDEILRHLGILDETQVEATISIAQEEQVLAALSTITAGIEGIPASTAFDIQMAINNKDPERALQLINEHLVSIGEDPIDVEFIATDNADEVSDDYDAAAEDRTTNVEGSSNATDVSGDLDDAAADRDTTITAGLVQQLVQGLLVGAFLDWVARPRTAPINAEANASWAELVLNLVARARTSDLYVALPNAAAAEEALSLLARDRTSNIFVRTVQTGGGGGTGGAVPSAAALGATRAVDGGGGAGGSVAAMPVLVMNQQAPQINPQVTLNLRGPFMGSQRELTRAITEGTRKGIRLSGARQVLTPAGRNP